MSGGSLRGTGWVVATIAALALIGCTPGDPEVLPGASSADVHLRVGRTGSAALDLRLGGSLSAEELTVIGHQSSAVFAPHMTYVAVVNEGAGDFVRVRVPAAYAVGSRAVFAVDLAPVSRALRSHGFRSIRLVVDAPRVEVSIVGTPPPTRDYDYSATWEGAAAHAPAVTITMAPSPSDFWMLLFGFGVGLLATLAAVTLLFVRKRIDSVALYRWGLSMSAIATGCAGSAALALPTNQVDDIAVAGIASGWTLGAARIIAACSYPLALAAVIILFVSRDRRVSAEM